MNTSINIFQQYLLQNLFYTPNKVHKNFPKLHLFVLENNQEIEEIELLIGQLQIKNKRYCDFALEIIKFPDWEILPYDKLSPHPDIISTRLNSLHTLCATNINKNKKYLILTTFDALAHKIAPVSFIKNNMLKIKHKTNIAITHLQNQLEQLGYFRLDTITSRGEYAIRGSIFDIFPFGNLPAVRLDFFGDEIEIIKKIDLDSQRTTNELTSLEIMPTKEYGMKAEDIQTFTDNWQKFFPNIKNSDLVANIKKQKNVNGLEHYLSLFHNSTVSLFDYIDNFYSGKISTIFAYDQEKKIEQRFKKEISEYENQYQRLQGLSDYRLLPISQVLFDTNKLQQQIKNKCNLITVKPNTKINTSIKIEPRKKYPFANLSSYLYQLQQDNYILFLFFKSNGRLENTADILAQHKIKFLKCDKLDNTNKIKIIENQEQRSKLNTVNLILTTLNLHSNFFIKQQKVVLIAESELLGTHINLAQSTTKKKQEDEFIRTLQDIDNLEIGDLVVHRQKGIGKYCGLVSIAINDIQEDFILLEYQEQAKLYVPIAEINILNIYIGTIQNQPLDKLGSKNWQNKIKKAKKLARDYATELLVLNAKRSQNIRVPYKLDEKEYQEFKNSFEFQETEDQSKAINDVLEDMQSKIPVDRLICGDVGFGKTEIAMRATYLAVSNNKQVLILAPTTILVQQHFDKFNSRFADFGVNIDFLSRFKTKKQAEQTIKNLKDGKIDILISTHKILSQYGQCKNLGLLIIDEEHRFGVRQKELIKKVKSTIDIISMTATPIPRTLNMSLNEIKSLSIISSPPKKRINIQTFIEEWSKQIVIEAVTREVKRGGQIFYICNDIKRINYIEYELQQLLPQVTIASAHGQMNEKQLQAIMQDFYNQKIELLICTTIIETGIDIPTTNTIIIEKADNFGLAQLHQLRGRVGRSYHQAYAYLLVSSINLLTKDAKQRLNAIARYTELGSGFNLSTQDLEIRGAGEILGENQSGAINSIGFYMYFDLIKKAIKILKSNNNISKDEDIKQEINFDIFDNEVSQIELGSSAIIPEEYIKNIHIRLKFYSQIFKADNDKKLQEIKIELIDRFGLLPDVTNNLIQIRKLQNQIKPNTITKIVASDDETTFYLKDSEELNIKNILNIIQNKNYDLKNQRNLVAKIKAPSTSLKVELISKILKRIY